MGVQQMLPAVALDQLRYQNGDTTIGGMLPDAVDQLQKRLTFST
jgi:hypothetical protein